MKIGGVDPTTLSTEEILVLPRGEKNVIFRAVGIPDYEPFNVLCPEPTAPKIHKPKEGWVDNVEEPGYRDMVKTYGLRRLAWLIIMSLEPSKIEWDTVNLDKPGTWTSWEKDMKANGFNHMECQRIQNLVFQANSLDDDKLDKALAVFLRGQQPVPNVTNGQRSEPEITQSGKPASE